MGVTRGRLPHRGQGRLAWTVVGLPPRYPPPHAWSWVQKKKKKILQLTASSINSVVIICCIADACWRSTIHLYITVNHIIGAWPLKLTSKTLLTARQSGKHKAIYTNQVIPFNDTIDNYGLHFLKANAISDVHCCHCLRNRHQWLPHRDVLVTRV